VKKKAYFDTLTLYFIIILTLGINFSVTCSFSGSTEVTVYFFDVGQGDSIFIDTDGEDMLIDGGPHRADLIILDYLSKLNVSRIDIMVATHPDADHIGGLIDVLNSSITVNMVLYNNQTSTTKTYQNFMKLAEDKITVANRSQVYVLDSNVNFTVLNPTQPLEFDDENSNSIVLKLQIGTISFLFAGDATFETEESMIKAGLNLESQVLKVAHHGSKLTTSNEFLDAVKPIYAVISAGKNNPYGHPHEETIQRLLNHNVTIYGTFASGTIIMSADGQTIEIHGNPEPIPEHSSTTLMLILILITLFCFTRKLKFT